MRLYIAGPMTGLPDFNYPAFMAAEKQLAEAGYEVENPARNELKGRPEGEPMWLSYMRMSLVQISKVDGLALLPGWRNSPGATLEHQIGTGLKLPVSRVELWLRPDRVAGALPPVGPPEFLTCPECAQGKDVNCTGQTLDPATDQLVPCGGPR